MSYVPHYFKCYQKAHTFSTSVSEGLCYLKKSISLSLISRSAFYQSQHLTACSCSISVTQGPQFIPSLFLNAHTFSISLSPCPHFLSQSLFLHAHTFSITLSPSPHFLNFSFTMPRLSQFLHFKVLFFSILSFQGLHLQKYSFSIVNLLLEQILLSLLHLANVLSLFSILFPSFPNLILSSST